MGDCIAHWQEANNCTVFLLVLALAGNIQSAIARVTSPSSWESALACSMSWQAITLNTAKRKTHASTVMNVKQVCGHSHVSLEQLSHLRNFMLTPGKLGPPCMQCTKHTLNHQIYSQISTIQQGVKVVRKTRSWATFLFAAPFAFIFWHCHNGTHFQEVQVVNSFYILASKQGMTCDAATAARKGGPVNHTTDISSHQDTKSARWVLFFSPWTTATRSGLSAVCARTSRAAAGTATQSFEPWNPWLRWNEFPSSDLQKHQTTKGANQEKGWFRRDGKCLGSSIKLATFMARWVHSHEITMKSPFFPSSNEQKSQLSWLGQAMLESAVGPIPRPGEPSCFFSECPLEFAGKTNEPSN